MDWNCLRIGLALAAVLILLSAGLEDVRSREIADRKPIALVVLAPAWWWSMGLSLWPGAPIQLALAAAIFALFAFAFYLNAMGGGDVKLIAALSLWLPVQPLVAMLATMAIAGGAVTLAMLAERAIGRLRGRVASGPVEVPYGVAIAVAGILALREPIFNQFV
ncbi:peptidase [Sphingomonas metalli]|uniref:Peptidase n=1 Tax=Sphingomonas metalli TaxID=1779358 RepID=A0A916WP15_9SPHN|nr:prepilin peptidase [Sphingomonas metalli]GGB16297.1 peptidase [Sphingomonas metalli]